jgi:EmrB/QacA subfamily drug resistance transporter
MLYALSEGQSWGWTAEATVLMLLGAAWLLSLFVFIELATDHPLLDLRVFRHRVFSLTSVLIVVVVVALYAGSFYVPLYMQEVQGYGAFATGLTLLPSALAMGVLMPLAGRLYDAVGARVPAIAGLALLAVATWLFLRMTPQTTSSTIAVWMTLRSVGLAMTMMPVMTAGLSVIPTTEIGRASAINNIIQRTSGSLGLAVLTAVYTRTYAQLAASMAGRVTATTPGLGVLMQQVAAAASRSVEPLAAKGGGLLLLAQAISNQAFTGAVHEVFGYAALSAAAGMILVTFLREQRHGARTGPTVGME